MLLNVLSGVYTVCKVASVKDIDWSGEMTFVGKTDEELSLVCSSTLVPASVTAREDGWRAMRIEGMLDFSLIGILSRVTAVLAEAKISVFCVSTYNTDYILVKEHALQAAVSALTAAGYAVACA